MIKLRAKQYRLPGGALGREFTSKYASVINSLAQGYQNSEASVCFVPLILQKDKNFKKTADIRRLISRRLKMWSDGNIENLISEAEQCDQKLPRSTTNMTDEQTVKVFSRLMLEGKIREATRFLTERETTGGVLSPDDDAGKPKGKTVMEVLQSKHPEQATPCEEAFVECPNLPDLFFVEITSSHIQRVANKLSGGAGPSGLQSTQLQELLLKFGNHSAELREAYASVCRRLANNIVDWEEIRALKAKRLIALNKCPGIRPIGIGEVGDRFLSKTMAHVTGDDVKNECGSDQLCSGIKGGIEAAVHGMQDLFQGNCDDGWGLLLVDASNAFNSMSRLAALWNARVLWSRCSIFLFNSYQGYAVLIVRGASSFILSKEGVTQGDPLGMMFYGVGILPLTRKLKKGSDFLNEQKQMCDHDANFDWNQNWYADDSACASILKEIVLWLKLLIAEGPKYGYHPEPDKSYLIVHPDWVEEANKLFCEFKVNVVTGHRFLGGFVGGVEDTEK